MTYNTGHIELCINGKVVDRHPFLHKRQMLKAIETVRTRNHKEIAMAEDWQICACIISKGEEPAAARLEELEYLTIK